MDRGLYNKWRPMTFGDVIGQEHITSVLKAQAASGRLSHAYLFCGTRGTGKTTCARILTKAANCENLGKDGDPCNECPSCRAINDGSMQDVTEIDAASNNSIDNIRSLRDEAMYVPTMGRMKVYIIDEVHGLSSSAFNALLKVLEEPPEHVLFILATTEAHAVPATITSRCQNFAFRRIRPEKIEERLSFIAAEEGMNADSRSLSLIARLSDGAMRNALSMLEQCALSGRDRVDYDTTLEVLGLSGERYLLKIASLVLSGDVSGLLELFDGVYNRGEDVAAFLDLLELLFRDFLVVRLSGVRAELMGTGYSAEELAPYAERFSEDRLFYSEAAVREAAQGVHETGGRRLDAELCLMRLARPETAGSVNALSSRVAELERKLLTRRFAPEPEKPTEELLGKPEEEERPTPAEKADMPELSRIKYKDELMEALKGSIEPTALPHLRLSEISSGEGRAVVSIPNEMSYMMLNKPELIEAIGNVMSNLEGRVVKVRLVKPSPGVAGLPFVNPKLNGNSRIKIN